MENQINNQQNKDAKNMQNEENLKSKVLELIDRGKIKPKTKIYFSIKDKAFWSLVLVCTFIGSIAVSIIIFSFTNSESEFYQMTSDSYLNFILQIIPYLWVLVFVTFAIIGYENFKHTNKGYKYSFWLIVLAGLVINIIFGIVLHSFGVSKIIDQNLHYNNVFFRSSDSLKRVNWDQPERGVLSGEVVSTVAGTSTFILRDFNGDMWAVSSEYVPEVSKDLISTSSEVRVIGIIGTDFTSSTITLLPTSAPTTVSSSTMSRPTNISIRKVTACYILPWDSDDYVTGISKIKGSLNKDDLTERNISNKRNNSCRTVKSYNIIREMVELK